MATALLRKLSAKTIMGGKIRAPEAPTFLYRIAGRVTGIRTGNTDFGPFVAFKGNFQAQRADGETFAGPQAFVPEPVQSMLEDAVNSQLADGLVPSIQFGIDVFCDPADDTAIGYTFRVVPILKPADETDSLLSDLNKAHALPSPEAASEAPAAPKKKAAARK